ncbi:MAG: FAD-dependent oxidoreductase [Phycisphaeraceae bacterium]
MSHNLHYFHRAWIQSDPRTLEAEVCVYGGTSAGVVAAVAAARRGRTVILLQPGLHLGGMTSGGLGWTDYGQKHVIGGMSRQFYRDLGKFTNTDEQWHFEPHAAEQTYRAMLDDVDLKVFKAQYLDKVQMDGKRIASVTCLGGLTVKAHAFVDVTYEGDLMARAGVSYTVGRESNDTYGEKLNGVQVRHHHQFSHPVDPYVEAGNPQSGTLPYVNPDDAAPQGSGDHRIQAYCFRVCMTDKPDLRVPWAKPADFDPRLYVLATRWFNSDKDEYNEVLRADGSMAKFDRLGVKHKTDTNNHGPISSDFIGANYAWPEADYITREKIFQQHVSYQQGYYWHMANDPAIPDRYREAYSQWGLARDEFEDTGHWPHQLYVREARRMVADHVLTEADCRHERTCDDPVGMGSYNMDSHNCQRIVRDGRVLNEGDVQVAPAGPYGISYKCIVPKRGECENLAVPVCCSTSHICYGSVRMEPVFMILGESAALAIDLALRDGAALQDVPYDALRPELDQAGQVVELPSEAGAV